MIHFWAKWETSWLLREKSGDIYQKKLGLMLDRKSICPEWMLLGNPEWPWFIFFKKTILLLIMRITLFSSSWLVCVYVCVCVYMLMCLLDEISLCGLKSRKSHEFAFFLVILFILKFFLMISNLHFCSSPKFQPGSKGNRKNW